MYGPGEKVTIEGKEYVVRNAWIISGEAWYQIIIDEEKQEYETVDESRIDGWTW